MNFAEGYERIRRTWQGSADRAPVVAQMHEFALACSGKPGRVFYRDAASLVDGIAGAALEFGLDLPGISYDVYNIELEALGQPILFPDRTAPVADDGFRLLADKCDLASLRPPDPGRTGRMPFVLGLQRGFRELTGQPPGLQFCAPFSLAALVRGYQRFIEDICLDPAFAHELLCFLTEQVIAPWIIRQKEEFPEAAAAAGADAFCSPPMTSPAIIEEFSIPYILRLRELCPIKVTVVNWWGESSCPDPLQLLDLKRKVSTGLIRVQDPDLAALGARPFKDYAARHGLVLELGLGEIPLHRGPIGEIEERIRSLIGDSCAGDRLIVYLASLNADTPPDNLRAAVAAVKRFG
jgi:uroporphyrinogen decarboxylase